MAEENPHIEIKVPPKPINNSREQYLFENEKLILGRPGFIFRIYPTLQERLQEKLKEEKYYKIKQNNNSKISRNNSFGKLASKNILNNTNKNTSHIFSNKTQSDILSQPILRFKNRTDLERICDTIQPYVPVQEQEALKEIRSRHVHSIDFPKGILYKGSIQNLKNFKKNIKSHSTNNINDENNFLDENNENNRKPEIYFTRLQRLNVEAKKIRSNLHFKTHFKGVESVFINPKQIYNIIKKEEDVFIQKKIGNYAYNDKLEKDKIEKRNEYKKDINDLLLEEKEKQKIISTKEFSNYLNNKEYYNDRVLNINSENKESEEDKIKRIKDMNYLRQLAFKDSLRKSLKAVQYNESGNINTENSSNDNQGKNYKKNINFENEHQLRIGGKIYHMQNQMDQIAKEILNKCKFYSKKIE
jgi:hypothetical protein